MNGLRSGNAAAYFQGEVGEKKRATFHPERSSGMREHSTCMRVHLVEHLPPPRSPHLRRPLSFEAPGYLARLAPLEVRPLGLGNAAAVIDKPGPSLELARHVQ